MSELEGTAKVIFNEIMEEIGEEIEEGLSKFIAEKKLIEIITIVRTKSTEDLIKIIQETYRDEMKATRKLILGEKASRVVSSHLKSELQELLNQIVSNSFDLIEELRNEIIGEVFEETE